MAKRSSPTMADIARIAGVSSMTVSRAFKHDSRISAETRDAILKVAEETGYVFDATASNLRSQKTGFVAVTIPSLNNANFADTVEGLSRILTAHGMQILLGYTNYDVEAEERLIEQFLRRKPQAVVVTGGQHTARCRRLLTAANIPVVETWDMPADPLDRYVGFSNAFAMRSMVDHFVTAGYRRIAFIGGEASRDPRGEDRRQGFIEAMRAHGLEAGRLIAAGPPPISMREGAEAMARLLDIWPDTEAVLCVSDLSAYGALSECQRRGISVPGRIAIGGFGDYEIAGVCVPPLTTIDARAREIGEHAGRLVLALLQEADGAASITLTPRLIVRQSSR